MKKILTFLLIAMTLTGFSQKATNYWNGSFKSYWHNDSNWSLGHIPTSTEDMVVATNTNWFVNESVSWLNVNQTEGTGHDVIEVEYTENNTGAQRVGEIIITTDTKVAVVLTVAQSGTIPELSVDQDYFDFNAANGIAFLNVYSNTNWTISDNMDWLGLNYEFPSGNQMVQISVEGNYSGMIRTGEIIVETLDGSIQIVIPVRQGYFVEQIISLPAGWSGLSSYAKPLPPFIENAFAGIADELIIALTEEGIYYPEYGVNTIGMWEDYSAYKIKTTAEVDLEIFGSSYLDFTIDLEAGWNLLPVISESAVDAGELFEPVVADIEMVKDVAGYGVYWPGMGINTIGTLIPGNAYYVLMDAAASVDFGSLTKGTSIVPGNTQIENPAWNSVAKSPSTHVIGIRKEAISDFDQGDFIGIFNQQGVCAGQTRIDELQTQLALVAFGNDPYISTNQGFSEGEELSFRYFNTSTGEEFELIPEFDLTLPDANGLFNQNGRSAITGLKAGSTGTSSWSAESISVYPNPSTGVFKICGILENAHVEILDMQAQLVMEQTFVSDQIFKLDLSYQKPGVYMMVVKQDNKIAYHKLILK